MSAQSTTRGRLESGRINRTQEKIYLQASIVVEGELAAMNTATGGRHCSTASIEEIRRSHIETAQSHKCVHRADRLALFGVLSPLAAEKQGVDNLE